MDEFKFVVKSFLITLLFFAVTQIKTNNSTVEAEIMASLHSSTVGNFINQTAAGGVKITKQTYELLKSKFEKTEINVRLPSNNVNTESSEATNAPLVIK